MRVISQKGIVKGRIIDIPYEGTSLLLVGNSIYFYNNENKTKVLAVYSSSEKAEKAMEMLWGKYEEIHCWNAYYYSLPSVFRFPEDSEV